LKIFAPEGEIEMSSGNVWEIQYSGGKQLSVWPWSDLVTHRCGRRRFVQCRGDNRRDGFAFIGLGRRSACFWSRSSAGIWF
jgi:hypothetical protein